MVLAAGRGTRLGQLTQNVPKPMLDVAGRPVIHWILSHLVSQGFGRLAVNLHYLGHLIREHVDNGQELGIDQIKYFDESVLLGTAGAVRNAGAFLIEEGCFLVQYGDVVTDQDLRALVKAHRSNPGLATMVVHQRANSNSIAVITDDGRVNEFLERPTESELSGVDSHWVFSGICVLEPAVLDRIPAEGPSDLPKDVFGSLVAERRMYAHRLTGFRVAVDSRARLERLREAVARGECRIR